MDKMGIQKKGYMGKIMQVNLSSGQVSIQKIPDRVYESFLSGMGLAAFFLYHKIPENTDPLGPDNVLGFVSGLLNGTGALFSGRWMAVGKSPLTGGWGEANCGGYFAPAIKRCGVDAIFFSGISPKPVYLYVDDKGARIRSAEQIWGMDAVETEEFLLDHHSRKNARVACIGPAGERLSLISGISTDKGRMAARSGLGAIMGSKGLKALVLAGTARIRAHNRDEIKRISRICNKWVQFQPPFVPGFLTAPVGTLMRALPFVLTQDGLLYKIMLRKWGTVSMNQISVEMGDAPIKNWKGTSRDWGLLKSLSSNPGTFTKRETRKYHCHSCPLGCGGICENHSQATHKPEYETVLCFGGLVMNQDMDLVFQINEKLNRAGMDSISAGHCVAFAMECFEAGILTTQDTQGVELGWGDPLAISFLVDAMIKREGIGDILADGVKAASQKIGKRSHEMAVHAGGQEPGMHDSRNDPGFALHYSADPAPGRHTNGAGLYYEMYQLWKVVKGLPRPGLVYMKKSKYKADPKQAKAGKANSEYLNVLNGAGVCLFGAFLGARRIRVFDWINGATGWNLAPEKYMEMGKNIQTLKQAFNLKQGLDPVKMKISGRPLGDPAQTRGANKNRQVDLDFLVREYWQHFGWDPETGKPHPETIKAITSMALD